MLGHEIGAENWALLSSVVATCKLNDVNPVAYLAETFGAIINGHPQSQIEELMPCPGGSGKRQAQIHRRSARRLQLFHPTGEQAHTIRFRRLVQIRWEKRVIWRDE
ncbi:transposase domain-containing protein [Mesorhizobium sp.]|uniref:transposase domain-containing protein n=1 Tax=Mesorhizobium sp. TaxID=1871066 RepID=UPI0025D6895A|nr:transposase domain-containing protein [Mesorhizobium sp.]